MTIMSRSRLQCGVQNVNNNCHFDVDTEWQGGAVVNGVASQPEGCGFNAWAWLFVRFLLLPFTFQKHSCEVKGGGVCLGFLWGPVMDPLLVQAVRLAGINSSRPPWLYRHIVYRRWLDSSVHPTRIMPPPRIILKTKTTTCWLFHDMNMFSTVSDSWRRWILAGESSVKQPWAAQPLHSHYFLLRERDKWVTTHLVYFGMELLQPRSGCAAS